MPALPLELIRHVVEDIIDDVDDPIYYRHLSVVSLSCRLLRHEAQRLLFRDSGELYTSSTSRKETTLFLDTVISSPERLALFVNTLSINFNDFFSPDSDETTALVQKLSRALQIMRNLQSLDVSEQIVGICSLPNILHDVHFKLTSFCWSGYGADTELEGADIKANFLRCQDRVEHLQLSGFIEESTLKPIAIDICPRLQSLAATYSITELILPKKEFITSLRWISPVGEHTIVMDNPFHLDLISEPLGRVRYLSYDDINDVLPVGPKIQHIAPYLTSLVCLDTNRGDLRKVEALSQLPCLKILILSEDAYFDFPEKEEMVVVAEACKALEQIDIEDDEGNYSRFECFQSTKQFQIYKMEESDRIIWIDDFDLFDD